MSITNYLADQFHLIVVNLAGRNKFMKRNVNRNLINSLDIRFRSNYLVTEESELSRQIDMHIGKYKKCFHQNS